MLKNLGNSINTIEGIGPKIAGKFNEKHVHTLMDLIMRPWKTYYSLIADSASESQVKSWQQMAFLMQADQVNGQYAEALHKAGVTTLLLLGAKTYTELSGIFEKAKQEGIISKVPEIEQVVSMLTDAAALNHSRFLIGRLIDKDKNSVADATVTLASVKTSSNANGFFKIAVRTEMPLTVQAPGKKQQMISSYRAEPYADGISLQMFTLELEEAVESDTKPLLSEFAGDEIPSMNAHYRIKEVLQEEGVSVRSGDTLLVRSIYKDQKHVKLQSVFHDFDGDKFMVYTYKVALEAIGFELKEREYVFFSKKGYSKVKADRSRIKNIKKLRKINKTLPKLTGKPTFEEIQQHMKEKFKLLKS